MTKFESLVMEAINTNGSEYENLLICPPKYIWAVLKDHLSQQQMKGVISSLKKKNLISVVEIGERKFAAIEQ